MICSNICVPPCKRFGAQFDPDRLQEQIAVLLDHISHQPHRHKLIAEELNRKSQLWQAWIGWSEECGDWINELSQEHSLYELDPRAVAQEVEDILRRSQNLLPEPLLGNAIIEISVGPGGQEACAWKDMMVEMYVKWCQILSYPMEIIEHEQGSASPSILRVVHPQAMHFFGPEHGAHRLIRASPFDKDKRTHTSFVHVLVGPEKDIDTEEVLHDKDIQIDVMRSSGAGGQHVNKTESGVRMVHLPTKIQVVCKHGRSQHANKKIAWNLLQAKLDRHNQQRRQEELQQSALSPEDRGWGRQIRTYHFIDNRVVKHDTKETHHDVEMFMAGKRLVGAKPGQP